MNEHLSASEKFVLDFLKESYNEQKTNPLTFIDSKIEIKIQEDVLTSLQEKGYIEVNKTTLDSQLEMFTILLNTNLLS